MNHTRLGSLMSLIAWIIIFAMLFFFFSKWLAYEEEASSSFTSRIDETGAKEVVIKANRHNHYVVAGKVNDVNVMFMIDTGASDVSVPKTLADRLSLRQGIPLTAYTAGGTVTVYATRLEKVEIGPILLSNVAASINPHAHSNEILFGMSALKNLEFTHTKGTLIIRQVPK